MVQSAALLFEGETPRMFDINQRVAYVAIVVCQLHVYYDYFYSVPFPPYAIQSGIFSRYQLSNLDQQLILQSKAIYTD